MIARRVLLEAETKIQGEEHFRALLPPTNKLLQGQYQSLWCPEGPAQRQQAHPFPEQETPRQVREWARKTLNVLVLKQENLQGNPQSRSTTHPVVKQTATILHLPFTSR